MKFKAVIFLVIFAFLSQQLSAMVPRVVAPKDRQASVLICHDETQAERVNTFTSSQSHHFNNGDASDINKGGEISKGSDCCEIDCSCCISCAQTLVNAAEVYSLSLIGPAMASHYHRAPPQPLIHSLYRPPISH